MEQNASEVVVLGAGYAGLLAALRLSGSRAVSRITLVNAGDRFVERIRLQERIAGPVEARIASISALVAGTKIDFVDGCLTALDAAGRSVTIETANGTREVGFGQCLYALGSHIDAEGVQGAAEFAFRLDPGRGPKEVLALRAELEEQAGRAVRVVVVGGANTATEVAAEIKAKWPLADVAMISSSRIGDFGKGPKLERLARAALARQKVRFLDNRTVVEVRASEVVISDGTAVPCDICVWAAGLKAPDLARRAGLDVDEQDRILCDANLRSVSHPHILAAGDALLPLAPCGAKYRMSAFAALISAAYAADSVEALILGRKLRPFSYAAFGQGVAIGKEGLGFFTFANDTSAYFLVTGTLALRIRNLFVWSLVYFLKRARRSPHSALFWIGRRRIGRKEATPSRAFASRSPRVSA